MENPINMDDFGIHFRKPPHWVPLAKHGSVWVEARHQDGYHWLHLRQTAGAERSESVFDPSRGGDFWSIPAPKLSKSFKYAKGYKRMWIGWILKLETKISISVGRCSSFHDQRDWEGPLFLHQTPFLHLFGPWRTKMKMNTTMSARIFLTVAAVAAPLWQQVWVKCASPQDSRIGWKVHPESEVCHQF